MPGSHLYYHLYFIDRFRRLGGKELTPEEKEHFDQFKKKYPYQQELRQIEARFKLLKYDEQTTEEGKAQILQEIKSNYISEASYEHYKPEDF